MSARETPADLSEFDALERSRGPATCKMARCIEELSEQDRVNLHAVLQDESRSNLLIARWFRTKGFTIGDNAIRIHRTGDCVCARSK
jgi:hypothetical protein